MARKSREGDNWIGIQDSRKRKQIQDRLAQRARRKRLAESKQAAFVSTYIPNNPNVNIPCYSDSASSHSSPRDNFQSSLLSMPHPAGAISGLANSGDSSNLTSISVCDALFQNGAMLGISWETSLPSKSERASPDVPESLKPTPSQLASIHSRWIDQIPFPKVRDNLIALQDIIEEEEFLSDLLNPASFAISHGAISYDPTLWKVGKQFWGKWGYLFY